MVILPKIFILLLLTTVLFSCTAKKSTPRKMEISFGSLVANDFVGGAIIRVENASTGVSTLVNVSSPPFSVLLDDGIWNFYFVGFVGPGAWLGATSCGEAVGINLGPSTLAVNITAATGTCASIPYPALIATKVSNWDVSLWNQTTWAP